MNFRDENGNIRSPFRDPARQPAPGGWHNRLLHLPEDRYFRIADQPREITT
jgi:hypothetical protein